MITNTKFSKSPNVYKIGVVLQLNMHSKQQNTFQIDSPIVDMITKTIFSNRPNVYKIGVVLHLNLC